MLFEISHYVRNDDNRIVFGAAALPPKASIISRATVMYAEALSKAEGEVEEPQP